MRTPRQVVEQISAALGVEVDDARDRTYRSRSSALRVRRIAAYVLRVDQGRTWGEIGRALGCHRVAALRHYQAEVRSPGADLAAFLGGDA